MESAYLNTIIAADADGARRVDRTPSESDTPMVSTTSGRFDGAVSASIPEWRPTASRSYWMSGRQESKPFDVVRAIRYQ